MKSAIITRDSLRLYFDNSRCPIANIASDEMMHFKCNDVPHSPYSPDLAIANFDLFGALKQELQDFDGSDEEELKMKFGCFSRAVHRTS
jgi:hypothetical protein